MKIAGILSLAVLLGCGSAGAAGPSIGRHADAAMSPEDWDRMEVAYASQQKVLQSELGQGIFVASYKGLVHDGRVVTFSIWTDSVRTALPKTDFVWLQNAKMTHWFVVRWSDLEAAIGKLPALEQRDPPRYLTPTNISRSYFNRLEKTFVAPAGFPKKMATGRR